MRAAMVLIAGLVVGSAATGSILMSRARGNEQQAYDRGYRDGWGKLSSSLGKHFDSRSPAPEEVILDPFSMKNISIDVVERNGAKTLLILD